MIVAIDGPAGAGKGTVARLLAARLGFHYVDTGALYRAVALACVLEGVDPKDADPVESLAGSSAVELVGGRVRLNGEDVTDRIRHEDVTAVVSSVAAHPAVRASLIGLQRAHITRGEDVVMEGRDIGTTVAPDADVKIFLTASEDERARRRALQLGLGTDTAAVGALRADMARRDRADASRRASPFQQPVDAIVVDSTDKTIEEVVRELEGIVQSARARSHG